ncbi:hypothetical protein CLAC_02025 [Corynebacterium lactis RW2-5]|uniref:Uncharacterized protein n=1 Tax=Corynebacterium lactis RW2-5 TaxID=1408189 RepID=A0A0K2H2W4_9CORY|nr:hypothetical protein CLAC_02025 [Corynebacterium lactis RW2-5]
MTAHAIMETAIASAGLEPMSARGMGEECHDE